MGDFEPMLDRDEVLRLFMRRPTMRSTHAFASILSQKTGAPRKVPLYQYEGGGEVIAHEELAKKIRNGQVVFQLRLVFGSPPRAI